MSGLISNKLKLQSKLSAGRSTVGIDIGTSSVNIAQMALVKGKPTLIQAALVNIVPGPNEDHDAATLTALKKAVSLFNIKNAKIACVVNCSQTCVRKIVMPYMPKDEMDSAVRLETKRSIPFPLEDAVLDFNIIEEVVVKGVEKLSVLVAASPKTTVARLQGFFTPKKAKPFTGNVRKKFESEKKAMALDLKISALLPLSMCLENIIERSKLRVDETLVTIEMGTVVTELNIYRNSRLQFSRKISFSGDDITKSLTGALMTDKGKVELTIAEAERIKREYGIPGIEENRVIDEKMTTNQILSLIRPKVEQLANEIERSFDFYREEMHGGKVERVVLFGGGAQLKGLPEFLSRELDMDVHVGNPLADIDLLFDEIVEHEADAHRLVLAIGAALSGMKGINLIPVAMKERTTYSSYNVLAVAGSVLVVGLLFLTYIGLSMRERRFAEMYQNIKGEFSAMAPQLHNLKKHIVIDRALTRQPHWGEVLKEIGNFVPPNMFLTKIEMKENILNVEGVVRGRGELSGTSFSEFMLNLEKGILRNVKLVRTEKKTDDSGQLEFGIKCRVD